MRTFLFCVSLLFSVTVASAHIQEAPDLATIARSDSVYLVRVASVNASSQSPVEPLVTFSTVEVLRGEPTSSLRLHAYPGSGFKNDSEWILFRHAHGFKDCVGWAMKGDCEWLPVSATSGGGDWISRYRFSVDQVRDYLHQHPASS